MSIEVATIQDVRKAEGVIRQHLSPAPLMRSYALEKELGLEDGRRVWLKDYGWTPVGSFKLLGALNWMANNLERIGDRPVAAHSSGNFASGISYAGMRYGKRVVIVMPESAPKVKFALTRSFGAEILTYDIATDHQTGQRDKLTRRIAEEEGAVQASPYDDPHVIAGNGVGGLEIVDELRRQEREVSHFLCQVSGGGLMAGHALAIADGFAGAQIVGIEPEGAADFCQSLASGCVSSGRRAFATVCAPTTSASTIGLYCRRMSRRRHRCPTWTRKRRCGGSIARTACVSSRRGRSPSPPR